jgi:murein DD-endopeptidase MepM/ murein hydrolase activator NlpD
MKGKTYTFFIASTPGKLKKLIVPAYVLHGIAVLAIIGGITVVAAAGSYSRMLWKVGNYNALRHDQQTLKRQYQEQYTFLKRNAAVIAVSSGGLRLMPAMSFADSSYTPSIWPVLGHITDSFGERLDPFSGEGAFHTGVDVATDYGAPVHATADGIITIAENHAGYGRLVVIDHGFGITTWYAHLSSFSAVPGARVKRGEVVGYTGISGRSTGPHVHYEVRMNNAPINPWRYMRATPAGD